MGRAHRARPMTNVELVDSLCAASAPLREARRVHLQNYGNLIPHVFMSDVLRHMGECLRVRRADPEAGNGVEIRAIVDALEQGMVEGDRETCNVIAVSFTGDSELELFFRELLPLLGPRTRAQLQGK
jgi:hypothetical protein